jgi:hypothetical protein
VEHRQGTSAEFRVAIAATADALQDLVEAGRGLRDERTWPDPGTIGSDEIELESRYAGEWHRDPVHFAHTTAGMLLFHAEDHGLALAHTFTADHTPIYADVTLARGALEASARARWLLDPSLTVTQRIGRAVGTERYSQQERLKIDGDPDRAKVQRRVDLLSKTAKKLRIQIVTPPPYTVVIPELFGQSSLPDSKGMGLALARVWAATAHGTLYALRSNMDTQAAIIDPLTGNVAVPIQNTTPRVEQTMTLVMIASMYALDAQRALLGWRNDRLDAAIERSRAVVFKLFGE